MSDELLYLLPTGAGLFPGGRAGVRSPAPRPGPWVAAVADVGGRDRRPARRAADSGGRVPQRAHPPQDRRRLLRRSRRPCCRCCIRTIWRRFPRRRSCDSACPRIRRSWCRGSRSHASRAWNRAIDGDPFRFRTCYPVTVWPVELTSAVDSAVGHPVAGDTLERQRRHARPGWSSPPLAGRRQSAPWRSSGCASSSTRRLSSPISSTKPSSTTASASSCPVTTNAGSTIPLDRTCIQQVGFERDEALVEYRRGPCRL